MKFENVKVLGSSTFLSRFITLYHDREVISHGIYENHTVSGNYLVCKIIVTRRESEILYTKLLRRHSLGSSQTPDKPRERLRRSMNVQEDKRANQGPKFCQLFIIYGTDSEL